MGMQASQAMSGWVNDAPPPFQIETDESCAPADPAGHGGSSAERFEAEAMPHLKDLFRTALRMTGERGRAEDVLQEVYLQAWRSFERFESGTNCRAWLY